MINWKCTKVEEELAVEIAKRAVKMAQEQDIDYDQMKAVMDIEACHCNGTPLKLRALLNADNAEFAHDVFGIRATIDRNTGKLTDNFLPRYAE